MRYFRYVLVVILILTASFFIYSKFKGSYYDIPELFREANKYLFFLLVFFQIVAYFNDGWFSKMLIDISDSKNISLKNAIKISILGTLGNQVAPFFGAAAITYYFYKKFKVPSGTVLFLVTFWTIFVWSNYIIFLLLSLFFLPKSFFHLIPQKMILIIAALTVILMIFIFVLGRSRGKNLILFLKFFINLINKIKPRFNKKNLIDKRQAEIFIEDFYKSLGFLVKNRGKSLKAFFASTMFYFSNIATLYFSFLVFGFRPNIFIVIFGFTIASILAIFTLVPETPGVIEASLAVVYVSLGFPAHIALFSSLLFRITSYWLPLPVGIIIYFKLKKSLR